MFDDLRYAVRMLLKNPGFTAAAVLTLAIGIGLCTTIFSAVNPILFRPLPFERPGELAFVTATGQGFDRLNLSYADYLDWRAGNTVFEDLGAWAGASYTLGATDAAGETLQVGGARFSSNLFAILGAHPIHGRHFTAAEEQPGSPNVVMLSHGLWTRRFGADPGIVNQPILVDGEQRTVVGIMPADFGFPEVADMWTPLVVSSPESKRGSHSYSGVARLKPGVTLAQAHQDLVRITDRLAKEYPVTNAAVRPRVSSLHDALLGDSTSMSWVTLCAVGFVLAVACANVANLLLARALDRQKEFAIRSALGAGRWRTIRQVLIESLVLAAIAGTIGFAISGWGLSLLISLIPRTPPRYMRFDVNYQVLAFAAGISVLTCLLFGLAPAWRAAGMVLQGALKESGRTGHGRHRNHMRSLLVITEVALAVLLLSGAGLMIRTVRNLQNVDPGFDPDGLLVCEIRPPNRKYGSPERVAALYVELERQIGSLPGVNGTGAGSSLPMDFRSNNFTFAIEGQATPPPGQRPSVNYRVATRGYLKAMRIPILLGRDFNASDTASTEPVAIVEESFAQQYFPGEDPIGRRIQLGSAPWSRIVGVAGNVKHEGLNQVSRSGVYVLHDHESWSDLSLLVRTGSDDPLGLVAGVRAAVRSIDPAIGVEFRTMEQIIVRSIWVPRFFGQVFGAFSIMATTLAAVGIAAVLAFTVTQRTHEIGVRMALGAQRINVLVLVLREGMMLVGIGLAIGLLASAGMTRFLASELYGVGGGDPVTLVASGLLFAVVAAGACLIPASRATRVDPMVALRSE